MTTILHCISTVKMPDCGDVSLRLVMMILIVYDDDHGGGDMIINMFDEDHLDSGFCVKEKMLFNRIVAMPVPRV